MKFTVVLAPIVASSEEDVEAITTIVEVDEIVVPPQDRLGFVLRIGLAEAADQLRLDGGPKEWIKKVKPVAILVGACDNLIYEVEDDWQEPPEPPEKADDPDEI